ILMIFAIPYERSTKKDSIQWLGFIGKISRDIAYNMTVLSDGIVVVGWTSSLKEYGDQNVLVVKLSKDGKFLWQKELGGSGTDGAICAKATKDGGFVVTIISDSQDGDFPSQFGGQDIWLLKYNSEGSLEWKKCYGTKGYETAFDVIEDDGYVLAGYTTVNGSEDFWVVKTDYQGNVLWDKTFGGSDWDTAFSLTKVQSDYVIVGMTKSHDRDIFNNGSSDMWFVRVSRMGELLWQKTVGGSDWDQATNIISTKDGGFAVCGVSWSKEITGESRMGDFVLTKFDIDGNQEFLKTYGGSSDDIAQKLIETDDGYVLIGTTWSDDGDIVQKHRGSDYWLIKTDKKGNLVWQKCLGDDMDEIAYALQVSGDGYLVAGVSYSYVAGLRARSHGGGDILLVKVR
ncbi:MAG TPA: hypothetical protein VIL29_11675, partial [Pseudothermotoga sp.]